MDALCQAFNLENAGSLLYIPIPAANQNPIGGILLLSPYSAREWTEADQDYLEKASVYLQPLVERGDKYSALTSERNVARSELQTAQAELIGLKSRLDQEEFFPGEQADRRMMSSSIQADKLASMTAMHAEAQKKIEQLYTDLDQLRLENEQLRLVGVPIPAAPEHGEEDLPQSRDQVANLEYSLVQMTPSLPELETVGEKSSSGEKLGEVSIIARDLEEPMTSIVDYTDLLLGESIGTLGPLQKKYVDKVRASTEILGSLVNDLVQVTRMDTGRIEIKPELVELNLVVDNAMGFAGTMLREKNLTLRLDIPEVPSHIIIDGEVLQQILVQLMKNATCASPVEGVVTLRMQVREQDGKSQLLLQVTDTGEGIAPEQIPLIFSRRYGTDQAHIPGVGDTGVGLAIVKTLVEIQGGQIWVDSQEKGGSTFNVVLPMELSGTGN
jgi:signal transduction histidine kinase